ncbi:facilitated trehalose transporter Tret1-like isoform X1 [Prorops nasuta]|uniref:facilitated trehalose transporter Tret1-like isoform X1 n=1 Tax=Prorops nasuta TaxID=863751 RepID=UPI0034CDC276
MGFIFPLVILSLGCILAGSVLGWSSPYIAVLEGDESSIKMSANDASWVVSIVSVGSACSMMIGFFFDHYFGRRKLLMLSMIPFSLGWLLIAFALTSVDLTIGRYLVGFGEGIILMVAPAMLSELAPIKYRGSATSCNAFSLRLGVLITYVIGAFLSMKLHALIHFGISIVYIFLLRAIPESPYFLISRGQFPEAEAALISLRNSTEIDEELKEIIKSVEKNVSSNTRVTDLFKVNENRKPLIAIFILTILVYLSGGQCLLAYAESIFDEVEPSLSGKYLAIILAALSILCSAANMFCIDRLGRKTLLICSLIGSLLSTATVATYLTLKEFSYPVTKYRTIPLVALMVTVVCPSFGILPTMSVLLSELFFANIRVKTFAVYAETSNISTFVALKTFHIFAYNYGLYVPYLIFSGIVLLCIIHVCLNVPETFGKTLDEIHIFYLGNSAAKNKVVVSDYEGKVEEAGTKY